jgi:hypothetical protein
MKGRMRFDTQNPFPSVVAGREEGSFSSCTPSCHASCRLDRTVTLRGTEEMKWLGMERNSSSVQ